MNMLEHKGDCDKSVKPLPNELGSGSFLVKILKILMKCAKKYKKQKKT